jgi:hypothetical protein
MKKFLMLGIVFFGMAGSAVAQTFTAPDLVADVTTYVLPMALAIYAAYAVIWPLKKGGKFLNRS